MSAVFRCLSHHQRRRVLYYLRDHGTATVEELARHLVSAETDEPPGEAASARCERVETALHHVHLPKLVDALIAEYDPRSETVRYSDPPDALEPFLDIAERVELEASDGGYAADRETVHSDDETGCTDAGTGRPDEDDDSGSVTD